MLTKNDYQTNKTLKHIAHRLIGRICTIFRSFLIKHFKMPLQRFIQLQDRSKISRTITIVRRRPDLHIRPHQRLYSTTSFIEEVLITIHSNLMSTANQIQTIHLVELLSNITTEDPTSTTEITLKSMNNNK